MPVYLMSAARKPADRFRGGSARSETRTHAPRSRSPHRMAFAKARQETHFTAGVERHLGHHERGIGGEFGHCRADALRVLLGDSAGKGSLRRPPSGAHWRPALVWASLRVAADMSRETLRLEYAKGESLLVPVGEIGKVCVMSCLSVGNATQHAGAPLCLPLPMP